jgi:molybdenum-dependent DNA-binding transcriptional regulator ModE
MYYGEKIRPVVEAQRGGKLTRAANLALIKKITAEMWADETTEVKRIVEDRAGELEANRAHNADQSDDESVGSSDHTAEDFQK